MNGTIIKTEQTGGSQIGAENLWDNNLMGVDVSFTDSNNGWGVGRLKCKIGTIFRTTNGGEILMDKQIPGYPIYEGSKFRVSCLLHIEYRYWICFRGNNRCDYILGRR